MSRLFTLCAAALVSVALAVPALARDHHDHDRDHHGFRGGVFLYDPIYPYPYGQPDYGYAYAPSGYAYFCPPPYNGYYPYVASCPVGWQLVPR